MQGNKLCVAIIISDDNKDYISKILENKLSNFKIFSINSFYYEEENIDNKFDCIIGIGDRITEVRQYSIDKGFNKVLWNLNLDNNLSVFVAFNKSDFGESSSQLINNVLKEIRKEIIKM